VLGGLLGILGAGLLEKSEWSWRTPPRTFLDLIVFVPELQPLGGLPPSISEIDVGTGHDLSGTKAMLSPQWSDMVA
jgi:hypothetical protein